MVLVGILDHYGHESHVANTGLEAVLLAPEESFDLCLMDLDMPEMDGIEATKQIRGMNLKLPIYAMTAHHDPHHEKLCLDAGMNGYLTKPINNINLTRSYSGSSIKDKLRNRRNVTTRSGLHKSASSGVSWLRVTMEDQASSRI